MRNFNRFLPLILVNQNSPLFCWYFVSIYKRSNCSEYFFTIARLHCENICDEIRVFSRKICVFNSDMRLRSAFDPTNFLIFTKIAIVCKQSFFYLISIGVRRHRAVETWGKCAQFGHNRAGICL